MSVLSSEMLDELAQDSCMSVIIKQTLLHYHLPLQAFVATIMELKARSGTIYSNFEKSNDGNPRKKVIKMSLKTNNSFNSTMMASSLPYR